MDWTDKNKNRKNIMEWKSKEISYRGRPWKIWMVFVEEDFKTIEVRNWMERVANRKDT